MLLLLKMQSIISVIIPALGAVLRPNYITSPVILFVVFVTFMVHAV
jgi:hypothetical protein